jgi:nitrate/nitrite transport system substrate-binding protein
MKFHNDGAVNFPYLSDGMWFLTQHKRWGLLTEHPDYLVVATKVNRIAIYQEVAGSLNVPLPASGLRRSTLFDGKVWDGTDPKAYADSFALKA